MEPRAYSSVGTASSAPAGEMSKLDATAARLNVAVQNLEMRLSPVLLMSTGESENKAVPRESTCELGNVRYQMLGAIDRLEYLTSKIEL